MAFAYKLKWEKGRYVPGSKDPYTISRSKVERFQECPRCFWLEARYGIGRPDSFPFTLNNAVYELFKREFDIHRANGEAHPLMKAYGIDAVPFKHKDMDVWRENFKGIEHRHQETGFMVSGAVDDMWVGKKGELYFVDYKSTSNDEEITSVDEDWP